MTDATLEREFEAGRELGQREGEVLALRAVFKEVFETRCGRMPLIVFALACRSTDPAELRRWILAAATSDSYAAYRAKFGA